MSRRPARALPDMEATMKQANIMPAASKLREASQACQESFTGASSILQGGRQKQEGHADLCNTFRLLAMSVHRDGNPMGGHALHGHAIDILTLYQGVRNLSKTYRGADAPLWG